MDNEVAILRDYILLYESVVDDLEKIVSEFRIRPLKRVVGEDDSDDGGDLLPFNEKAKKKWIADVAEFLKILSIARSGHISKRKSLIERLKKLSLAEERILQNSRLVNLHLEIKDLIEDIKHTASGFLSKKEIIKEISNGLDKKLSRVLEMSSADYLSEDFTIESVDFFGIPII